MKFLETSKYDSLRKSTYVNLRWIGITGQLISVNLVYFYFNFSFDFVLSSLVILIGILSNLYLIFIYKKVLLSDRSALLFLTIDILQLSILLFLTGGIVNPFIIFLILPSVFASTNLSFKSNLIIIMITTISIIFLTFYSYDLPKPLSNHFHVNPYYYFSIPISLVIALYFLNYFAILFGRESRLRKEALNKMEEVMAKEHEMLSLGGQAAAAAHSLGTPLSTIKIITQELMRQLKDQKDVIQDVELLSSQVESCNQILRKSTPNPIQDEDFMDEDIRVRDYLKEIILSFKETSKKVFVFNIDQDSNSKKISRSIEIIYGLRNFIGNANKYSSQKIHINLRSDNDITEINIEDDGNGYPKEILSRIGEPYLTNSKKSLNKKSGLGLGIFIGKTLLEKNFAVVKCKNSDTRKGAEVSIKWRNKDLFQI